MEKCFNFSTKELANMMCEKNFGCPTSNLSKIEQYFLILYFVTLIMEEGGKEKKIEKSKEKRHRYGLR